MIITISLFCNLKIKIMKTHALKIILLLAVLFSASCSSEHEFTKKGLVNIDKKISGSYHNTTMSEFDRKTKLSEFFNLFETDSVTSIKTQKNTLYIDYVNATGKHVKTFQGNFKNKFFEFYHYYDTLLIPPLIVSLQERGVRLSLDENSNLVVNEYHDNSGMILIFGAGSSGNSKYVFTKNQ